MYVCVHEWVCDSVTVVALDTHHPPCRQYSRWPFLSLSTSSLVLHHITKPASVASRLLIASLRPPPPPPSPPYVPHFRHQSINQSITQSSWRGIRCNMSLSLSLSLLNEGIVVSERERERERERENVVALVLDLLHPESMCVCYDTANSLSLSIVTLPTKHTMCVCV